VPKSATPAMVTKLNTAARKALDTSALRARLDAIGLLPAAPEQRSPEYLRKFVESEIVKWAAPVKASGLMTD
jgi:tripartite-type tricarboxylate transporter receptor subunit TctC